MTARRPIRNAEDASRYSEALWADVNDGDWEDNDDAMDVTFAPTGETA